jgi:hypothetical protein
MPLRTLGARWIQVKCAHAQAGLYHRPGPPNRLHHPAADSAQQAIQVTEAPCGASDSAVAARDNGNLKMSSVTRRPEAAPTKLIILAQALHDARDECFQPKPATTPRRAARHGDTGPDTPCRLVAVNVGRLNGGRTPVARATTLKPEKACGGRSATATSPNRDWSNLGQGLVDRSRSIYRPRTLRSVTRRDGQCRCRPSSPSPPATGDLNHDLTRRRSSDADHRM